MTSLPKVQVTTKEFVTVDLARESDLAMCAASLVHAIKPKTTTDYAKMIYSIQGQSLKPIRKHGHTYITPSWRVRHQYARPKTKPQDGDPVQRIITILLNYLSPSAHRCVEALLLTPGLLGGSQ